MDQLGTLLTTGLVILAFATACGFGLQRGRIGALKAQLEDSDEELERKDRRLVEAESTIGQLQTDLEALARVVTGEAHWTAIGDKLDTHHAEASTHWTRDEQILEEIRDRLPPRSTR